MLEAPAGRISDSETLLRIGGHVPEGGGLSVGGYLSCKQAYRRQLRRHQGARRLAALPFLNIVLALHRRMMSSGESSPILPHAPQNRMLRVAKKVRPQPAARGPSVAEGFAVFVESFASVTLYTPAVTRRVLEP